MRTLRNSQLKTHNSQLTTQNSHHGTIQYHHLRLRRIGRGVLSRQGVQHRRPPLQQRPAPHARPMGCPAEAGLQGGRPHLHAGTSEDHRQVPWRPVRTLFVVVFFVHLGALCCEAGRTLCSINVLMASSMCCKRPELVIDYEKGLL